MANLKSNLWYIIIVLVVFFAGCATFEGEIPVDVRAPATRYISPANQDGVQDALVLDISVPEIEGLVLDSYRFSVVDSRGQETFVIEESRPSDLRGRAKRASLSVPASVIWDGRGPDGQWAPDGEYTYYATVRGADGQEGITPRASIIVDNTPPSLILSVPYPAFSPNGDGRQDVLPFYQQESTVEKLWEGRLIDSDEKVVESFAWEGLATDFVWDGLDENRSARGDGEYRYEVSSTDEAGNPFALSIPRLLLDTSPATIGLMAGGTVLSPNGDGVVDTVALTMSAEKTTGIKEWNLAVVGSSGDAHRTWKGNKMPATIVFDGKGNRGVVVADGDYFGTLTVTYANGDRSETASGKFVVDTTPPSVVLSADYFTFSPDGDGNRDSVTINQSSSVESTWTGRILNSSGVVVMSNRWPERLIPFAWNGLQATGLPLPDGKYRYEVTSVDGGGNATTAVLNPIVIDNRQTPVSLNTGASGLSPNGDGIMDSLRFLPVPIISTGISSWSFRAEDDETGSVWSLSGTTSSSLPEVIVWNGRNDQNLVVEGRYRVSLVVEYEKGNRTIATLESMITVDVTPPVVNAVMGPLPFSPDGDGYNDVLTVEPTASDTNRIASWGLDIRDPRGNPFLDFIRGGEPVPFRWVGKRTTGELVRSAEDYPITVSAVDEYGNRGRYTGIIPVDILVIADGDRLRISVSSIYFKPFTADYLNVEPDLARKNKETLDRLSEILKKYGDYAIRLEGHAVRLYWNDSNRWRTEEKEVLQPLSTERAIVIRDALVRRGIKASRISTAGFGGTQPLVPHSDELDRWKNRRVEFILVR